MKLCDAGDCDRPSEAHGLCSAHYQRLRHWGEVREDIPVGGLKQPGWCAYHGTNHYPDQCPEWPEMVRLWAEDRLTLDAIGKRYGYTRERIRQIIKIVNPDASKNRKLERRAEDMELAAAVWAHVNRHKPQRMADILDALGITESELTKRRQRRPDLFPDLGAIMQANRANRTEKRCSTCGETKPITDFHKGGGADGRSAPCKPCANERANTWRPVAVPTVLQPKVCPACRRMLWPDYFARSGRSKSGMQTYCNSCHYRMQKGETVVDINHSYGHEWSRSRQEFG